MVSMGCLVVRLGTAFCQMELHASGNALFLVEQKEEDLSYKHTYGVIAPQGSKDFQEI